VNTTGKLGPVPSRGRADIHLHTNRSDGWPEPWQVVDHAARRTDLDVIAVTDHDTIEGALRAAEFASGLRRPHVIIGEEVSSRDGHIVGLFLERRVRPGMSAASTVHAIHEQGGLAVAAHPFWRSVRRRGRAIHGVGLLAAELDFDAIEIENSTPGLFVFNQLARRLNEEARLPEVGGSDAHILDAVGCACTTFPGKTPEALREAFAAGRTRALRRRYRPMGLVRYAAWSVVHQRTG
jgi:predicted metal-dependent phosphoesterase TrpH